MAEGKVRLVASEEMRRRPDAPEEENPYWAEEEPEELPDPSLGCVRRGLCCRRSPGRFAPGEVEAAAALLGLEPDALVRRYLVIDVLEVDGEEILVFAPVKVGRDGRPALAPASRTDRLYRTLHGPCVFWDGQGCRIYAARPLECRRYLCSAPPETWLGEAELARLWRQQGETA
jgi:Fe-S-cluster containining protein